MKIMILKINILITSFSVTNFSAHPSLFKSQTRFKTPTDLQNIKKHTKL